MNNSSISIVELIALQYKHDICGEFKCGSSSGEYVQFQVNSNTWIQFSRLELNMELPAGQQSQPVGTASTASAEQVKLLLYHLKFFIFLIIVGRNLVSSAFMHQTYPCTLNHFNNSLLFYRMNFPRGLQSYDRLKKHCFW